MDAVIHQSVQLRTSVSEAFDLFIEPTQLTSWLTAKANVEPTVGGRYELFWQPETPEDNSTIGCRITALVPNQLLAFEWRSPKPFKHFANDADPLTHVVVSFVPGDGKTTVHLVHSGWRSTDEWAEAMHWQTRAWEGALAKLSARVHA
ncbi:MAG: SRPBCC domain-containing protein [Bacteroidota bacterium]